MLTIKNLCKTYKKFSLHDVSFKVSAGTIMGLIGQNGAGKTTTIRLILNNIPRNSGKITIFGLDNITDEKKVKEEIGVVFDKHFFNEEWSIEESKKAISPYFSNWSNDDFYSLLSRFDLNPRTKIKQLSRGMQMKTMLAIALSHKAKLLIFDEPTSGLDPVIRDELLTILLEYKAKMNAAILFSTHIISDIEKIADEITYIKKGQVFYTGNRKEFQTLYIGIQGKLENLSAELKEKIIGLKMNSTTFKGMIKSSEITEQDKNQCNFKSLDIEEIMVHIEAGEKNEINP